MATEVVMPKMGESITEGTILRWLKKEGDSVQKDEPILEISTDKVDTEVPSPVAGTLVKILAQEKETVAVGAPLASIGANGEAKPASAETKQAPTQQPVAPPEQAQEPRQQTQQAHTSEKQNEAPQAAAQTKSAPDNNAQQSSAGGEGQAVVMPKMGESITEGTVLRWLKKEGDQVQKDEPILEISTDKVDTEVPAPFAGTLTKIVAQEKQVVEVGGNLAFISSGTSGGAAQSSPKKEEASVQNTPTAPTAQQKPEPPKQPEQQKATQPPQNNAAGTNGAATNDTRFYSPLVRSMAKEENISPQELASISGSGVEGRVNKNDVLNYLSSRKSGGAAQQTQAAPSATQKPAAVTAAPSQSAGKPVSYPLPAEGTYEVIPMDNMRQKIAEHMVRSVHTSAHVTSVTEVDVTNIVNFRNKFKDDFKKREGINLTYTPIFVEAMVTALKEFPFINASVEGTTIILKKEINFGVAVSLPKQEGSVLPPALIVPVIKHADQLNFAGIAHAINDLAGRARSKKLSPDDISGGTFTLTNPGIYGNLFGTPIINQPQVAIMTTGAIKKNVVVKTDPEGNDYMAIRSMMFLGLSYDHRLIDGMYGVQFTERVKNLLEAFSVDKI